MSDPRDLRVELLRQAMDEYRDAVLKGLRCDRTDGCWQRAVLAMPFLFSKQVVQRCINDLNTPECRRKSSRPFKGEQR